MNVLVYGDYFGYMAAPWYRNGHFVLLVHERFIDGLQDHRNATKAFGIELATKEELLLLCEEYEIDIILSSPPSREIVTVGSRYWKDKEEKHPGFPVTIKRVDRQEGGNSIVQGIFSSSPT